jgi:hypothetical protein
MCDDVLHPSSWPTPDRDTHSNLITALLLTVSIRTGLFRRAISVRLRQQPSRPGRVAQDGALVLRRQRRLIPAPIACTLPGRGLLGAASVYPRPIPSSRLMGQASVDQFSGQEV